MTEQALMTEAATTTPESTSTSQETASTAAVTTEQAAAQTTETTEAKPEGDKPAEAVPEVYEFTQPENAALSDEGLKAFGDFAKEAGLKQSDAQALLDKMAPAMAAQQAEAINTVKAQWSEQSKADKEFGGDKLNENLAVAKQALTKFGSPEFNALLEESGLGNHPEVIRTFFRAGKAISEDTFVAGNARTNDLDPARVLFPNMN